MPDLNHILRFYFITDENVPDCSMFRQAEIAISAGATAVQYRHKTFSPADFTELEAIGDLCRRHQVPLIVNDNVILAKAVSANGLHLMESQPKPERLSGLMRLSAFPFQPFANWKPLICLVAIISVPDRCLPLIPKSMPAR